MMKTIQLLILQSTAFCNINCDYCYLPHRSSKSKMLPEVLDRVHEQIINSQFWHQSSLLLWHAGEPLVLGVPWYRHAHEKINRKTKKVQHVQFQSNATLIDKDWIEFFRDTKSVVGVSIDGPKWLHDLHRKDRNGQGTFDSVMKGVRKLVSAEIPFTNIMTITKDALGAADEIFDFFYELRPRKVAFSIEEAEGANVKSSLYQTELLAHVEDFFHRICTRNFLSQNPLRIREIDSVLGTMMMPSGFMGTSQETQLGRIVAVGSNGDVAMFSPELLSTERHDGNYETVGNLLQQDFEEILAGDKLKRQFSAIEAGVTACRNSCTQFEQCGGGSPANKFFEAGRYDVAETWNCRVGMAKHRGIMTAIAEAQRDTSVRIPQATIPLAC